MGRQIQLDSELMLLDSELLYMAEFITTPQVLWQGSDLCFGLCVAEL